MAFNKEESANRLAAEFARIATDSPDTPATKIVAAAIAEEFARAFADAEVEVNVKFKAEVAAVPATIEVNETVKGVIK